MPPPRLDDFAIFLGTHPRQETAQFATWQVTAAVNHCRPSVTLNLTKPPPSAMPDEANVLLRAATVQQITRRGCPLLRRSSRASHLGRRQRPNPRRKRTIPPWPLRRIPTPSRFGGIEKIGPPSGEAGPKVSTPLISIGQQPLPCIFQNAQSVRTRHRTTFYRRIEENKSFSMPLPPTHLGCLVNALPRPVPRSSVIPAFGVRRR